jgi:Type I phosphodiesterase / nucleotide pyrophosphatase
MSTVSRREFLKTGLGAGVGLATGAAFPTNRSADAQGPSARVVLLVLDGLRPDSVTPELMPHTHRLASRGVFFADNHAVYPSTTMMNAAALVTGSYPDKAGLWGNIPWTPGASGTGAKGEALDYSQPVDIDDWANVVNLDRFYGGRLLLVPTLFQEAQTRGLTTYTSGKSDPAFCSTSSEGACWLTSTPSSPACSRRSYWPPASGCRRTRS